MLGHTIFRLRYSGLVRVVTHAIFWALSLGYLTLFFGRISSDYVFSFRFACLLLPIVVGTTYFINYSLIPKYLVNKRYGKFLLYFIYTLLFSVYFEMVVLVFVFIAFANYQYQNLGPVAGDFIFQAVGLYTIVFLGTSIKVVKYWMKSERDQAQLRSATLEAELKLKEAELQLLKGQIHPHFLFNTLNNLYGLALERSDIVPDSIIRLSSLLDFLLYRSNKPFVPLADEIKLINDYIELEKLRFEERLQLHVQVDVDRQGYAVAPFLLFPFVENAFKHGFMQTDQPLQLQVLITAANGQLTLKTRNSFSESSETTALAGGVGLSNVKKRLQLLYPNHHTLKIDKQDGLFVVHLTIDLSEDVS